MSRCTSHIACCRVIAAVLLIYHAWVVLDLIPRWSATYNEPGHIVAGLADWYIGEFDLYNVNPPLPRMVATVALLNQPTICLDALSRIDHHQRERQELELGRYFADTNALDFQHILNRARLAGVIWITLGGIIVWHWSHCSFGPLAGLTSLALWTFEPTITAHAALATADVPATVMGLAATYAFDWFHRTGSWPRTCITGALCGCALLCKFTNILLLPIWTVAWLLARRRPKPCSVVSMPLGKQFGRAIAIVFLSILVVNAGYDFRGTPTRLGDLSFISESFQGMLSTIDGTYFADLPCPVPAQYICGLDVQQRDFEGSMRSYLRGEWRTCGWWYYYLYAFIVKSPIGHLAIYGVAFMLLLRTSASPLLWLPIVLFITAASMKTGFTNHLRYILPAYPYMMILSGTTTNIARRHAGALGGFLPFVAILLSSLSVYHAYPHLVGFFNQVAGGYREGWRHLGGSNVDWGQDWIILHEWIESHPNMRPIHVEVIDHIDSQLYLRQEYPVPTWSMDGYAVVDTSALTNNRYAWLLEHRLVAQIGSSLFVFDVEGRPLKTSWERQDASAVSRD